MPFIPSLPAQSTKVVHAEAKEKGVEVEVSWLV